MSAPAARPGVRARLTVGVAALAAFLLLAEVAVRLLVPIEEEPSGAPSLRLRQFECVTSDGKGVVFDDLFESDPDLFWRLRRNAQMADDAWPMFGLIANGAGLREDHEIGPKAENELRILFLGDSCTFGYQVRPSDTVAEQVEQGLAARFPDKRIECINAGVPGYSLFQGWRLLERDGFGYEPDLVVLSFGWNGNQDWDGIGDLEHDRARRRSVPPPALRWSRLCQILWRARDARTSGEPAEDAARPRLLPEEFGELLRRVAAATDERGCALLLLVGANRANLATEGYTAFQNEQLAFARERGETTPPSLVDAVPIVRELAKNALPKRIFFDGVHPRPATNHAIAAAVVDALDAWVRARP